MSNSDLIRRLRGPYSSRTQEEAADALEAAEACIADVEQANRDCVEHFNQMRARAIAAEAQLKMVLDREAATTARYDAKLDAAETEAARLRAALEEAVEFAEQDFQALTPKGKVMIEAWRAALKEAKHE